jgi:hypothetical protein
MILARVPSPKTLVEGPGCPHPLSGDWCYPSAMCGRFTQYYTWQQVHDLLSFLGAPLNLRPRYNIAPTTMVDVVRLGRNEREMVSMRWGLVPGFWKRALKDVPSNPS